MELIRKGQSLKIVFLKYLVTVGFGLVGAIVLVLLTFTAFYSVGLIIPANYTENQILENKINISSAEKFDESLMPNHTSYTYFSSDGEIIQSNMNKEIKQKAEKFHNGEEATSPSSSFIEIKRTDGYVVINYQVVPHYTNAWMEKIFPKINFLFAALIIIFCFISTFAVTLIWVKQITRQLSPMLEAADKIAKQELDFEIGSSHIKEFNDVLNSLDKMKIALSDSLMENWIQEENKRSQISALTHDLKTPISIVKGNAELLKETSLSEEQKTYVDFIIKNSNRISDYSIALMNMNRSNQINNFKPQKVQVTTVVEKIKELAKEITSVNKLILSETINFEDRILMIDTKLFERVIQNILSNAVQYAPAKSIIELSLITTNSKLEISISDQGQGFSKEDLEHAMEQFYRGDKSRHSSINYGLGLYTSAQIMALHSGKILLQNKLSEDGAIVKVELPLYSNLSN